MLCVNLVLLRPAPKCAYLLTANCQNVCFSLVALLFSFLPFNVSSLDHIPERRRRCVLLHGRHGHVSQLVLPPSAGRSAHSRLGFVANQQLLCLPRRVSLWKCRRESSSDREHEYAESVFCLVLRVTCNCIRYCRGFYKVADPALVLVD